MKTLHQGELFTVSTKTPVEDQVASATKRFVAKHSCQPTAVRWNPPAGWQGAGPQVDKQVPPGHLWLELAGKP